MRDIHTVVIGGGQAGLAFSRSLTDRGIEHVVLERGQVGERWRSERWDSLHLLTPRWLSRMSGWSNDDADQDGFMSRGEVVRYLEDYATSFPAPLELGVTVRGVREHAGGYHVRTDFDSWSCRNVVIATGECDRPFVPDVATGLHASVDQVVPTRYRNPKQLATGGVLVVGASATGIQLAAEIHASGRPVTLAVGRHTRLPRSYRGRDILWWFDRMGIFDERARDVRDLAASRRQPSMQLVGSCDHRTLDLRSLKAMGVDMVGRAESMDGKAVTFRDDLIETTAAADLKLARLRLRIDRYIEDRGLTGSVGAEEPFDPVRLPDAPARFDLHDRGIETVLWATGFRRAYPWLRVPVLDRRGEIIHDGGITPRKGLYVLGLNFLRRRMSSFIAGVAKDAEEIAEHMTDSARRPRSAVACGE